MPNFALTSSKTALAATLMGALLVLAGCKTVESGAIKDSGNVLQATAAAITASKVQLATLEEVPGTYEGVLPCADCEGIDTTYHIHADGTFTTVDRYQGTKDVFKSSGRWVYKKGILILTDDTDPQPYMIRAELGQLRLLDADGSAVTDELAEHYVLKKIR